MAGTGTHEAAIYGRDGDTRAPMGDEGRLMPAKNGGRGDGRAKRRKERSGAMGGGGAVAYGKTK